nr:phosphotransferase [Streptomyces olivoverticillatus]
MPGAVRAAVEERTGAVIAAETLPDGLTCATALSLTTATGRTFVKGGPVHRAAQQWEVLVNPYVRAIGPRLLWQVVADGWDLLGFEYVDGRHADLSPGSPDLPLVAEALRTAHDRQPRPTPAVPPLVERWSALLAPGEAALLGGDSLLHTDTNPHNILIADRRAHLVDWAMPALGPAWADVAYTTVRLMEADCPTGRALAWAARFPCWRAADAQALRAFVAANCRHWDSRVGPVAARPSNARFTALLGLMP